MLDFFKNQKDDVALDISPYLKFSEVGREIRFVLDSGDEDLNKVATQIRLTESQSAAIEGLRIEGFDKIYKKFATQKRSDELQAQVAPTELSAPKSVASSDTATDESTVKPNDDSSDFQQQKPLEAHRIDNAQADVDEGLLTLDVIESHLGHLSANEISSESRKLEKLIKEAFEYDEGVVMGEVVLILANGEQLSIAWPVYNVVPSEVDGKLEFIDIEEIRNYIEDEWKGAFSDALVDMSVPSSAMGGAVDTPVRRRRENNTTWFERLPSKGIAILLIIAASLFVGYSAAAALKYFNKDRGQSVSMDSALGSLGVAPKSADSSAQASSNAQSENLLQRAQAPSAEEYATLHNYAKEELLKKMNINLDEQQDLGCLTQ